MKVVLKSRADGAGVAIFAPCVRFAGDVFSARQKVPAHKNL